MSESEYIKNHYGTCINNVCICGKVVWLGVRCQNWISCNCNTYEELGKWQNEIYNNRKPDA